MGANTTARRHLRALIGAMLRSVDMRDADPAKCLRRVRDTFTDPECAENFGDEIRTVFEGDEFAAAVKYLNRIDRTPTPRAKA